jgi:hypothetical protein
MSLAILYFQTKLPHITMVIEAEKKEGLTPFKLALQLVLGLFKLLGTEYQDPN